MGDLLELLDENQFKVRAYRQAAQVIDTLPTPVSELVRDGTLTALPGIGEGIAGRIAELVEHGTFEEHDRLAARVPPGVLELLEIEGVGPKTVSSVWMGLGIRDIDALEVACRSGRILEAPRMGELRARAILQAIARHRARKGRMLLHRALWIADEIVARLREVHGALRVEACGSVRRRLETVGDLDVLVGSKDPGPVTRTFVGMPEVASVVSEGPTKSSVRLKVGLQVDLRIVAPETFGAALHYFTGSKAHNIALRTRALRRGIKLSEYGVFDREGRRLGGAEEKDVFEIVGLPWIPPEIREGSGEIEAAEAGKLPRLIEEKDVLGDMHVHSDASSDGQSSLDELADEGKKLGRRYLAITDHSRSRPLGLDADALRAHARQVASVDRKRGGRPKLLRGVEVDILPDGSLDLPRDVLTELDWVVASVHSHFTDPEERMTDRIVRALESGVVDVLGHPSGRLIGRRDPYAFDLQRVIDVAKKRGVALEINAQPERLDLSDKACRLARDAGVALVISSDSHAANHLANLRFGVWAARRGWIEAGDVLNTRPWPWDGGERNSERRRIHSEKREARARGGPGGTEGSPRRNER
ncbi:MAG: DNA polymerase/3'-5' exonuclease PolX [Deltaproteobacteria bacterium]|nr:DNA polymerase/3'-5' exonuclease PolX [Deltaproteobacteria bacterium]